MDRVEPKMACVRNRNAQVHPTSVSKARGHRERKGCPKRGAPSAQRSAGHFLDAERKGSFPSFWYQSRGGSAGGQREKGNRLSSRMAASPFCHHARTEGRSLSAGQRHPRSRGPMKFSIVGWMRRDTPGGKPLSPFSRRLETWRGSPGGPQGK